MAYHLQALLMPQL